MAAVLLTHPLLSYLRTLPSYQGAQPDPGSISVFWSAFKLIIKQVQSPASLYLKSRWSILNISTVLALAGYGCTPQGLNYWAGSGQQPCGKLLKMARASLGRAEPRCFSCRPFPSHGRILASCFEKHFWIPVGCNSLPLSEPAESSTAGLAGQLSLHPTSREIRGDVFFTVITGVGWFAFFGDKCFIMDNPRPLL